MTLALDPALETVIEFPDPNPGEDGGIVTLSLTNRTNGLTHGLHRFPAKYIPQLPRWAIAQYGNADSLILDPFAGSGTTAVEASAAGIRSMSLELNPLSRLIIGAKTSLPGLSRLSELLREVELKASFASARLVTPISGVSNFEHWYDRENWAALSRLKQGILAVDATLEERRFLLVMFSSILRATSRADDQSQKTYVSGTNPKTPISVQDGWAIAVRRARSALRDAESASWSNGLAAVPEDGDALRVPTHAGTFDLAITSPPYMDSVDYPYNLMLEHFWLAEEIGIPSRAAFNSLRAGQVGAKVRASNNNPPASVSSIDFDQLPAHRLPAAIEYFVTMDQHFASMRAALRDGARYVMVVGNSSTSTGRIPLHSALCDLAAAHDLGLEYSFAYRVRRHYMKFPRAGRGGIILFDRVLVFRAGHAAMLDASKLGTPDTYLAPGEVAH
ncbi:hypothetical protein ARHIZOSPH14_19580 [Agromyces rhizosphaerae]|uniref:site-specific DNA-methyltransferase (cytosine-N(4)-specific) n=1 Tax=Agromyces rhizosphaerae TaxID=88374 RepID=A0A9W6CRR9_9MICO|nr:DNA methyltransferase [Agromyces rhizosphaerae]GLI27716.1 hypothetical protein ARHIZOSPH14_19580 [Agromyces rhizosphaerae]